MKESKELLKMSVEDLEKESGIYYSYVKIMDRIIDLKKMEVLK